MDLEQREFTAWTGLVKSVSLEGDEMIISGPLALTGQKDYDGDILAKAGVLKGLTTFFNLGGHVDWEHKYPATKDPDWLIGKAVEVRNVNGTPWLVTKLFKDSPLAKKVWALVKAGAHVGYSIYGNGVRDKARPEHILSTEIHMVTLAPQPKGLLHQFVQAGAPASAPGNTLFAISKALVSGGMAPGLDPSWKPCHKAFTTGEGVVQPGDTGGRALRSQYIGTNETCTGRRDCRCAKCKRRRARGVQNATVSKALVGRLRQMGAKHPESVAALIERSIP